MLVQMCCISNCSNIPIEPYRHLNQLTNQHLDYQNLHIHSNHSNKIHSYIHDISNHHYNHKNNNFLNLQDNLYIYHL